MPQVLETRAAPKPRFNYSPLMQAHGFIFTAGMIAIDPATDALAPGGPRAETAQILKNLVATLDELDLGLDALVSAKIYTTRFEDFATINEAWDEVFTGQVDPPVRTSIGVAALPLAACVEMEFILAKGT